MNRVRPWLGFGAPSVSCTLQECVVGGGVRRAAPGHVAQQLGSSELSCAVCAGWKLSAHVLLL